MNLLGREKLEIGILKSKYEDSLDKMERMNRINTAGLELFDWLHFATLKLENTIGTAKYAKHAKKIRMQRNTKCSLTTEKIQNTRKGCKGKYG